MDSLSLDVSKTRLHAFRVTWIGQTQVICSTEDQLIYIWYPVLHRTSDKKSQTIPRNPCCIVQWQPTKHQASPGRLLRTKQQASFCHSLNRATPASWGLHAFLVSSVWLSRTFLMFLQYSVLSTLQLTLSCPTQPFRSLSPNTCSPWQKDKFCLCLLRFSRNQNFSLRILCYVIASFYEKFH